jgi:hypothetical protein
MPCTPFDKSRRPFSDSRGTSYTTLRDGMHPLMIAFASSVFYTLENRFPTKRKKKPMAYKWCKPRLSINQFGVTADGVTDDDLVKITFENDEVLYVNWRDQPGVLWSKAWRPDLELQPTTLKKGDWVIDDSSGYQGYPLQLLFLNSYWPTEEKFETDSKIKSIRPVKRPRQPLPSQLTGTASSRRINDYH